MRKLLYITILLLFSFTARSQYYMDIGFSMGAANYLGEIGGKEKTRRDFVADMKLEQTRQVLGGFVRYKFSPLFSFKGGLTYAKIQGADNLSTNPPRVGRNLSFKNNMVELATTAEINFFQANDVGRTGRFRLDFRAYTFIGAAALYSNPQALYNGEWYDLRPLMTEGQPKPYSQFHFAIPAGAGLYYTVRRKHRLGWEIGWRTTFTDYLDDASTTYASSEQLNNDPLRIGIANRRSEVTDAGLPGPENYAYGNKRGDPTHNDSYFFTTISYSYVLRGKSNFYRSKYNFILGNKLRKRKTRAKF